MIRIIASAALLLMAATGCSQADAESSHPTSAVSPTRDESNYDGDLGPGADVETQEVLISQVRVRPAILPHIVVGTDDVIALLGLSVCRSVAEGRSVEDMVSDMTTETAVTDPEARAMIVLSVQVLCPEYLS